VETGKSSLVFNSFLSHYTQKGREGKEGYFVKKTYQLKFKGPKKRQKIGKSLIVNQPM
jgi:hypothetical protein